MNELLLTVVGCAGLFLLYLMIDGLLDALGWKPIHRQEPFRPGETLFEAHGSLKLPASRKPAASVKQKKKKS